MEQPQKQGLSDSEVYLIFDSHNVILFLGRSVDQYYLNELFEVNHLSQVAINRTEEVMFSAERTASSEFLTSLYSLINNVR